MVERLPTRSALQLKGIQPASITCPLCNEVPETCEHLFVSCQFAQMVCIVIVQWCKIPNFLTFSMLDLIQINDLLTGSTKRKKLIHAITLVYLWSIWRMRNKVVFEQTPILVPVVVEEIKYMSCQWVKNRLREGNLNWDRWRRFELF
ncbi:putative reverse transcriptase zinc-binding domain-containing protein [Helianthus annuus]|nr:putative reverse transcriptase zinc-binding domain-containing protein [Helianthus annuus]